tara:strand:+ start:649 stop:852 length:204 start_codon:yes stop_codon:yes gene_type:complete
MNFIEGFLFWSWVFSYTIGAYFIGWILSKIFKTPSSLNQHLFRWILGVVVVAGWYFVSPLFIKAGLI